MSISPHDKLSESKIIEQILQDYQEKKIVNYDEALTKINKCIEVKQESESFRGQFTVNQKNWIKNLRIIILPFRLIQKMQKHIIAEVVGIWIRNCMKDFEIAIGLNLLFWKPYLNRGITYDDMKQNEKAIMDYNKAIELNPECAHAFHNRGLTYDNMKQYEKAIMDYNKAIELNPECAHAFHNRGVTFINLQLYDKAILDFNQEIKINPNNADAFINRGILLEQQNLFLNNK